MPYPKNKFPAYCGFCGKFLPKEKFSGCNTMTCKYHSSIYDRVRSDRLKIKAINKLGGKCNRCGYNECIAALDLHHTKPELKDNLNWTTLRKRSWEFIENHIDNCDVILLCSNCHRTEHYIKAELPEWQPIPPADEVPRTFR